MKEIEREEKLNSLLDKEFLDRLAEVAKLSYVSDWIEVGGFIEDLYDQIGLETPEDFCQYDIEYDEKE